MTSKVNKKVLIAGAGAVGGYFGSLLIQGGQSVTFLARGEHGKAMQQKGLRIDSDLSGVQTVFPEVIFDISEAIKPFDYVFITVKSNQLLSLVKKMSGSKTFFNESTNVISLLNGLEGEEILSEYLPENLIVGGLAHVGAQIIKPGVLRHTTRGEILISAYKNEEKAIQTAQFLKDCNIPGGFEKDLQFIKWRKFVMNNSFNAVTALSDTTMGEAVADEHLKKVLIGCMNETVEIANKEGVKLPENIIDFVLSAAVNYNHIRPSMWQDVNGGKPTEHEALNGVICRLGLKHGIPTPYNDTLYALLEHRTKKLLSKSEVVSS